MIVALMKKNKVIQRVSVSYAISNLSYNFDQSDNLIT